MKFLNSLFLVIALTGCASAGVKVEQSKLTDLHKGKTTYQQAVNEFGQPSQTIYNDNGTKTALYIYYSAQARPETFIPVVGAFVGGADSENSTVTMNFDQHDVLRSYSSSQGSVGAGHGFEAQSQPIDYSQPRKE